MLSKRKDLLVFLVGCFATYAIDGIGRIYIGELIIFLCYILIPGSWRKLPKDFKPFSLLLILWLISQLFTDLYRGTPTIDLIKGSVSILFIAILAPFVYWALSDKPERWLYFYIGTIVSSQLYYYLSFSQTEFGSTDIWQVYAYTPLISGLAVFFYYKRMKLPAYIILIVAGFWILYSGSRNMFLIYGITAVVLFFIDRLFTNQNDIVGSFRAKIPILLITLILGGAFLDYSYENLASSGKLGDYAKEKYESQKASSRGIIYGGRSGTFMAIDLITKSPVIGYGSYAKDTFGFVQEYAREHGLDIITKDVAIDSVENMLPRHTIIFGIWMWHGIGGGVFWLFILFYICRAFFKGTYLKSGRLLCLSILTMWQTLWNLFFSILSVRLPILFFVFYTIILSCPATNTTTKN